jgi:hypothetical protein
MTAINIKEQRTILIVMKTKFGELTDGVLYLEKEAISKNSDWKGLEALLTSGELKELHFPKGMSPCDNGPGEHLKDAISLYITLGGIHHFKVFTDEYFYNRAKLFWDGGGFRGSHEEGYYWLPKGMRGEDKE